MKIVLQRLYHTTGLPQGDYTCGFVAETTGKFRSFVVEDTYRPMKVLKETRVPAGIYKLEINKVDTPLTIKHREAYNTPTNTWFKYHIEVKGIPGYSGVYIHAGNDDSHTEGCLLFNYSFDSSAPNNPGSKSTVAVEAFYKLAYPILEAGGICMIEIRDEQFLAI